MGMLARALPEAAVPTTNARFEEIVRALDMGFLELLGWDWGRRVITFPREHPVVGLPDCPVTKCPLAITVATRPMCRGCMERWSKTDLPLEEFLLIPKATSRGIGQHPCVVARCERPQVTVAARLCHTHHLQRTVKLGGIGMEEFLAHPKVIGLAGLGECKVAACYLGRVSRQDPYCQAHIQRLRRARARPAFDETQWRRTDKAICTTREISLRGMPDLLVAEVLYGLWARVQEGFKTRPECLRPLYDRLRAHRVRTLEEVREPDGSKS
ncbi:hypothetical protein AB0F24_38490 [Streptomyces platensis]|uniref:hypothetical protein n=1 Tax=Streptomyces platensis TaxID=58346 RepID=UPI0033D1DD57